MTDRTRERPAVPDAARRQENVDDVNRQLYELYDAGALETFSHAEEPGRNHPEVTVDVWLLRFPDRQERTMPYSQVRSFLRGVHLGWRFPRP